MKTIKIGFNVNAYVEQDIEILNDDTPEVFLEKLKSGDYVTTILDSNDIYALEESTTTMQLMVGKIVDIGDNSEYSGFELLALGNV